MKARDYQAEYEKWKELNPAALGMFIGYAHQLLRAGCKRLGAQRIMERMRWEWDISPVGGFKLNNSYRKYLTADAERICPEMAGKFTTRKEAK